MNHLLKPIIIVANRTLFVRRADLMFEGSPARRPRPNPLVETSIAVTEGLLQAP